MSLNDHHAAGPAVGYVFQLEQAMLKLLPWAQADEDAAVSVEVYDDVAFHRGAGSPKEVLQIHHSVNNARELLDTSAKWWRTLAIWGKEWSTLDIDERRVMTLVTTQQTRPGSALEALTDRGRNLDHAVDVLGDLAADRSGPAGTEGDRKTFHDLGPDGQAALLTRVTVVDGSPPALAVRTELERMLTRSHESRFVPALADGVEGWWWPRVLLALHDRRPILAGEMRAVIDEWRRSLSDRSLPIRDLATFDVNDLPAVAQESATFVACLHAIRVSEAMVERAVDDFLQAVAHRCYWARRLLVGPEELGRYDRELLAEWDLRCDRAFETLADDATERARSGRALYNELQLDVHRPLRPEVPDPFVQRGSFHALAEDERLAWHPDAAEPFRDALRRVRNYK